MLKQLSEAEIWDLVGELETTYEEDLVIIAQVAHDNAVRQIQKWGDNMCSHHVYRFKRECDACWQELKEEE